jgi:hypothetical protein
MDSFHWIPYTLPCWWNYGRIAWPWSGLSFSGSTSLSPSAVQDEPQIQTCEKKRRVMEYGKLKEMPLNQNRKDGHDDSINVRVEGN